MDLELIGALDKTGRILEKYGKGEKEGITEWTSKLDTAVTKAAQANPWFIEEFTRHAMLSVSYWLNQRNLTEWLSNYPQQPSGPSEKKRIGVVSAGNIPMAGFHDFLCVLVSGNLYVGKLSAQDNVLLPVIADLMGDFYPAVRQNILFVGERLQGFDAIIATGSNNSARYFEYYFRDYPKIIRKNRNSAAVLNGKETSEELQLLGDDIFMYCGLGCRSVSKLYLPAGYDITTLFPYWNHYAFLENHHKYHNNYSYYKSIYLVNREEHLDNGFVLVKPGGENLISPVSVLYTETYSGLADLRIVLERYREQLQCVVARKEVWDKAVPFGQSQQPGLTDYADGVDTLEFLNKLNY
jgi:hypothetical protein